MAPLFRVSVAFRSSFDRQSLRSLALVLSPSRSCALAINATWFTAAPVQYTWRAALWTSPRTSTAVWLGHSLLSTETARGRVMQDGEPGSSEEPALFTSMVPCASHCTLSTAVEAAIFRLVSRQAICPSLPGSLDCDCRGVQPTIQLQQ